MKANWELTDTFAGESNYTWVIRGTVDGNCSNLAAVRRAKKAIGWNGIRCRVNNFGDMIALYPAGICQVCFITFSSAD